MPRFYSQLITITKTRTTLSNINTYKSTFTFVPLAATAYTCVKDLFWKHFPFEWPHSF